MHGLSQSEPYGAWLLVITLCLLSPLAAQKDRDRDRDGLSDFQETHKYRTDPRKADSDGDGTPDGDWRERREFTYTIRTVIQVMPTYDKATLDDDYQDCRVLHECAEYIELEVVHYPLCTAGERIPGDADWRRKSRKMRAHLRPGLTTNWDKEMQKDLLARLKRAGIEPAKLTDKEVVERVSRWALRHAKSLGKTCVWAVDFVAGKPRVHASLRQKFEGNRGGPDWTEEQQFDHELFGKQMYQNRTRGTCTTSANYLATVLRAVGIPTRTIVTIPCVDASNPRNVEMVANRLTHHAIRRQVVKGLKRLQNSFAAHTYNEVWVAGRWRRLNYDRLGQPIVDPTFLGMMTKVHTFHDLAEAGLVRGWGLGRKRKSDVFRFNNPYTALTISDAFGIHGEIPNPEVADGEHRQLTITEAYWFSDDRRRPGLIGKDWGRAQEKGAGHVLVHVRECRVEDGPDQYESFYDKSDPEILLEAPGQESVPARILRCWWIDGRRRIQEFYMRIAPDAFSRMKRGVTYTLRPANQAAARRWVVDGVTLIR